MLSFLVCLLSAGVLATTNDAPGNLEILQRQHSKPLDGTFCLDTTPQSGTASICSLQGEIIPLGSAADLLVAGRFINSSTNETSLAGCSGGNATACAVYSTSKDLPWVAPDYSIQLQLSSSRLDSQKTVNARADLDFFLCNNPECTVVADLQYVDTNGFEQQPSLTMAYARLKDTTVGVPLLYLPASTQGIVVPVSELPTGLPQEVRDASLSLSRVLYPDDPATEWLHATPNMVPVGSWARSAGAFDKLRVGYYRAANLGDRCIRIIYPAHAWMHAHGWGNSHADCHAGLVKGLYAFSSYFTQAFWWESKGATVDGQNRVSGLSLHQPPQNLTPDWDKLAVEWQGRFGPPEAGPNSGWVTTHGMYTYCDDQSQSTTDAGTKCYYTDQSSGGSMSCDAARGRCVVAVIGSAPVVLWNLTEHRAVVQDPDATKKAGNRTRMTLRQDDDNKLGDYDNQAAGENPLGVPIAIGLRFLLPMIHMASAPALPWCDNVQWQKVSGKPFGYTYMDTNRTWFRGIPCHAWGQHLGFVNVSSANTPLGPSTQPLLQATVLVPTRVNMSVAGGFVGHERPLHDSLKGGVRNLIKASIRETYQLCALQVSLTDSTATWQGGLIALSLVLVSVIAVGTGRRDIDDLCMWVLRVEDVERPPKLRCIFAKVLSLLVAALAIVAPSVLVFVGEVDARKNNNDVNKVLWLSVPAHGWGRYNVLVAVTLHLSPEYDPSGFPLVQASLAVSCIAVAIIAGFSVVDFWKRCFANKGKQADLTALVNQTVGVAANR